MHALLLFAAAPFALAAGTSASPDWWLIPGQPGDRAALFADEGTLVRRGDEVMVSVLRVDRAGRSTERMQTIACGELGATASEEALRRFACAPAMERERLGLIVVGTPQETARLIFGNNGVDDGEQLPRF